MTAIADTAVHLHRDDNPAVLDLLRAVIRGRVVPGFEPSSTGAWVDWDQLTTGWLSTTERAVVQIARGLATLETHGVQPSQLAAIRAALNEVA